MVRDFNMMRGMIAECVENPKNADLSRALMSLRSVAERRLLNDFNTIFRVNAIICDCIIGPIPCFYHNAKAQWSQLKQDRAS